jgi:hypothetical protein
MLTTEKFIKELEKLGLKIIQCTNCIEIYHEGHQVAYVLSNQRFYIRMAYKFCDLPKELQEKLFILLIEYARTPLDKRRETQKFYLKFKLRTNQSGNFLNRNTTFDFFELNSKYNSNKFQTQFTQKEIDEMKEKFGVTLSDFEQIPVEESEEF